MSLRCQARIVAGWIGKAACHRRLARIFRVGDGVAWGGDVAGGWPSFLVWVGGCARCRVGDAGFHVPGDGFLLVGTGFGLVRSVLAACSGAGRR